MIDAENHAIDEHEVVHDKPKAIDTNDDIDVDYDYDDVHESEDINTVDNTNDLNGNPNKVIKTSVLLLRKRMLTMFVFKKSPKMMKIRSKKHLG